MEAADIKKIKDLEDESRRLKPLFADLSLEGRALKDIIEKALEPAIKRKFVSYLTMQFAMNLRQACKPLSLGRTVFGHPPDTQREERAIHALTATAERYPQYGFKQLFSDNPQTGHVWHHKRVHRIYCLLKLIFHRQGKQRFPCGGHNIHSYRLP